MSILSIQKITQFVLGLAIIALLALNGYLWSREVGSASAFIHNVRILPQKGVGIEAIEWPKPQFLVQCTQLRNLFSRKDKATSPAEVQGPGAVGEAASAFTELPGHLRVVAVIQGEHLEVVVEDTQKNAAFFLKEGLQQDELKLIEVTEEYIYLEYQTNVYKIEAVQP